MLQEPFWMDNQRPIRTESRKQEAFGKSYQGRLGSEPPIREILQHGIPGFKCR